MVLFGIIEKNIRAFKINSQIFYIMNIITEYQQKNSVFPLIVLVYNFIVRKGKYIYLLW